MVAMIPLNLPKQIYSWESHDHVNQIFGVKYLQSAK